MGWWGCKIEAFLAKKGTYERRGREDGVTVEGDEGGGGRLEEPALAKRVNIWPRRHAICSHFRYGPFPVNTSFVVSFITSSRRSLAHEG